MPTKRKIVKSYALRDETSGRYWGGLKRYGRSFLTNFLSTSSYGHGRWVNLPDVYEVWATYEVKRLAGADVPLLKLIEFQTEIIEFENEIGVVEVEPDVTFVRIVKRRLENLPPSYDKNYSRKRLFYWAFCRLIGYLDEIPDKIKEYKFAVFRSPKLRKSSVDQHLPSSFSYANITFVKSETDLTYLQLMADKIMDYEDMTKYYEQ
jgi:hypothetical protein